MADGEAKFSVGQLVRHVRFHYRGVVADVDSAFSGTEEWYARNAVTRPPRDRPWYHVLVHDAEHTTYVAERNLEPDESGDPVRHPLLERFFDRFESGRYSRQRSMN